LKTGAEEPKKRTRKAGKQREKLALVKGGELEVLLYSEGLEGRGGNGITEERRLYAKR